MKHPHDSIARDGSKLVGANIVFSAATFFLASLAARRLGPSVYGTWGVLWAIIIISAAFFPTVVMVAAREISGFMAKGQAGLAHRFAHQMSLWTVIFGLAATLIIAYGGGPLAGWLMIGEVDLIGYVALFFFVSLILALLRGFLEGLCDFNALALNVVLEGGGRLVVGCVILFAGMGLSGLLTAYIVAATLCVGVVIGQLSASPLKLLQREVSRDSSPGTGARALRFLVPVLVTHAIIVLLTNMDMILVKHSFTAHQAGLFSVCFTGGKLLFFFSEGLSSVMFPKVIGALAQGRETRGILLKSLGIYVAGAGAALLVVFVAARPIIGLAFGEAYLDAAEILFPYILFAAFLSGAVLLAKYWLALGHYSFLFSLVIWTLVLVLVLLLSKPSLLGVVWLLAAGGAILAFALLLPLVHRHDPLKGAE